MSESRKTGRTVSMADSPAQAGEVRAAALIASGDHSDPFSFLGPHRLADGRLMVRAFLPGASRVAVVARHDRHVAGVLSALHPAGVFAGQVTGVMSDSYLLEVSYPSGPSEIMEDPFRFPSVLGDLDLHLLAEGTHLEVYEKLGAHPKVLEGAEGVAFACWAPNAKRVSVVGDFNGWDGRKHPMRRHPACGVWDTFVPGLRPGALYKFEVHGPHGPHGPLGTEKSDPMGFYAEAPPKTASAVYDLRARKWEDGAWMERRAATSDRAAPISIYEVHLGSWRRVPEDGNRRLSYRELAQDLVAYVKDMGFTHVEFLPIHEHPFDGSWGYQPVGLFAPTCRFGTPDDFRYLVEQMHEAGIGVIIDWVAGHFPVDAHGLASFDGTHLYEHADPRQGRHRDWDTLIYNYGRREVANFLLANAAFWLDKYHVDGLRVDAVASMLYLDYSRQPGDWIPNAHGGNENLEAISFLRRMNELVYGRFPGVLTVAEESTAWPMVSRPTWLGGLGFGFKWNMGWMHDTLRYMSKEPVHRKYHHDDLTFGLLYAFHENFVLPLSHDEVVHGKGSLLARMPGDQWQRFANLRAYFGFMFTMPGKKLLFMGGEFAQEAEWNHETSLDWHLLDNSLHRGVQALVRDLNHSYRQIPALHQLDCESHGFAWIDCHDRDNSVLSYLRKGFDADSVVAVVCNFTPVTRQNYRIGLPHGGHWVERINTDAAVYGGSNVGNGGGVFSEEIPWHGLPYSAVLTLPPLATLILQPQ